MAASETDPVRSETRERITLHPSVRAWNGPPEHRSERVLVVDDDAGIRWLVRRILDEAGYAVVMACDGAAALRAAELAVADPRFAIHLVLTDLDMPGVNGFEVGRRLAAWQPALPVIYMSGTTYGLSHRARLLADAHFLQKPFLPQALLYKISLALRAAPHAASVPGTY